MKKMMMLLTLTLIASPAFSKSVQVHMLFPDDCRIESQESLDNHIEVLKKQVLELELRYQSEMDPDQKQILAKPLLQMSGDLIRLQRVQIAQLVECN